MVTGPVESRFLGRMRPFILFAPSEQDDRFDGQLLCLNDYKEGIVERDLVVVEVVTIGESRVAGEPLSAVDADALRKHYGADRGEFLAVLIGKDGVEKRRWERPISPVELMRAADEVIAQEEGEAPAPAG